MIIVEGWMRFADGKLETAREAIRELVTLTRQEPGCISYSLSTDLLDPNTLRIAELWESEEALQAHAKAPHAAAFGAQLRTLQLQTTSVKSYAGEYARTLMERL